MLVPGMKSYSVVLDGTPQLDSPHVLDAHGFSVNAVGSIMSVMFPFRRRSCQSCEYQLPLS